MPATLAVPAGVVAGLGVAGLGATAYAWGVGRKAFRLRRVDVPVLAQGASPLRVLHLSDLHATRGQPWKTAWVRRLAELEPDLVIDTGDNLGGADGVAAALDALGPLLERPGAFVPGSNDWFAPRPKNPARYLLPDDGRGVHGDPPPSGGTLKEFN